MPYTFDTGQIMRGLCAAIDDVPGARESLRRAADWMLTQVESGGRVTTVAAGTLTLVPDATRSIA